MSEGDGWGEAAVPRRARKTWPVGPTSSTEVWLSRRTGSVVRGRPAFDRFEVCHVCAVLGEESERIVRARRSDDERTAA